MKSGGDMEDKEITLSLPKLKILWEKCCDVTSKLESQVVRNPSLPKVYQDMISQSYSWLNWLDERIVTEENRK